MTIQPGFVISLMRLLKSSKKELEKLLTKSNKSFPQRLPSDSLSQHGET
jgi:hypothetical protein